MATSKGYRDYILEKLNLIDGITFKPMMGEYLLFYMGTFGDIYDNRLLVKITKSNNYFNLREEIIKMPSRFILLNNLKM